MSERDDEFEDMSDEVFDYEDEDDDEDDIDLGSLLDDDKFIVGVYNWCDGWCERCNFKQRCRNYAMQQEQEARLMVERAFKSDKPRPKPTRALPEQTGEPVPEVAPSIVGSIDMLLRMARDSDFHEWQAEEDRIHPYEKEPLYHRAREWSDRVGRFMKSAEKERPEIVPAQWRGKEHEGVGQAPADVQFACETIHRYHLMIAVKMGRATSSRTRSDAEKTHPIAADASSYDALGTAKLIYECLGKVVASFCKLAEYHRPWLKDVLSLAKEAESLRMALDRELPGHRAFRRPGFEGGTWP